MDKILVSACLAGEPCRYDGGSMAHPVVERLRESWELVLVCPEQLAGLPTPRPRHELRSGRVVSEHDADCTSAFAHGARETLRIAREHGCKRAVLKARSPSCGRGMIYDGTFTGRLVPGNGVTAALLLQSGIDVQTEDDDLPPR
jgi:uncharacterized protein YbbK (DUF523 family)